MCRCIEKKKDLSEPYVLCNLMPNLARSSISAKIPDFKRYFEISFFQKTHFHDMIFRRFRTFGVHWTPLSENFFFYQHRIGKINHDLCPECLIGHASTSHLFDCPAHPTQLNPADLWMRPWEVATFLTTLPAFSHLPAVGPLPQRRRRGRPPP